jgi:hypothetical protein
MARMGEPMVEQRLVPLIRPARTKRPAPTREAEQDAWRIVRYVEEPAELADLNRWWRHPTTGKPELVRYAVEVNGERRVWGLKSHESAVRWLARLTAPVQLEVPDLEAA